MNIVFALMLDLLCQKIKEVSGEDNKFEVKFPTRTCFAHDINEKGHARSVGGPDRSRSPWFLLRKNPTTFLGLL